jgi:hypothetical protein
MMGPSETFLHLGVWAQDSYGDNITYLYMTQVNGSSVYVIANYTTGGNTVTILPNAAINFTVDVQGNMTLFGSSTNFLNYTYVNATIVTGATYVLNNVNITQGSSGSVINDGTYYYVNYTYQWTSSLPIAGDTYNCSFNYNGEY